MIARVPSMGHVSGSPRRSAVSCRIPLLGLCLVVIGLLGVGCDRLPGRPKPEDRWRPDTAVMEFDALYRSQCAGCHSRDGRLAAARPLNDPTYLAFVDPTVLRRVITEGISGTAMPAFSQKHGGLLTDPQITVLVDRLTAGTLGVAAALKLPPYRAPLGDVGRGAVAYQTYCAKCHGPEGRGGPNGRSIVDPSYLSLVSDQALRTAVVVGRVDLGMPDWRGYVPGRVMSPQEISDVVAWLVAQRPQRPMSPRLSQP